MEEEDEVVLFTPAFQDVNGIDFTKEELLEFEYQKRGLYDLNEMDNEIAETLMDLDNPFPRAYSSVVRDGDDHSFQGESIKQSSQLISSSE